MEKSQTKNSVREISSTIKSIGDDDRRASRREAAIIAASRLIADRDVVFVGQGLPVIAALFAKRDHAPNCVVMHEYGVVDTDPPIAVELAHPLFAEKATYLCDMIDALASLIYHINVAFLGAAQIDRYGNVNTTTVGDYFNPTYRISGSGGANDIGSLAPNLVLVMDNQRASKFPESVDYRTTPGYFGGSRKRRSELNLPGSGPSAVVTDLGVYKFERKTGEMYLESLQPGVTVDEVRENTSWKIKVAKRLGVQPEPKEEEVLRLRELDPRRVYLR